ncbi:hypothetical protein [Sphingomonas panni]|uniref:hypothetical protein n=2 Tax=Sphingomonas TaxID=13687 RepID=UPI001F5B9D19|nr:hypothetical protein [Sphingomonas panni]
MMWAMAALVWTTNGLSLIPPRCSAATRLRQGVGVAAIILIAVMVWHLWSGTFRADIDLAWMVMMAGVFASDIGKRWAGHVGEQATDEPA